MKEVSLAGHDYYVGEPLLRSNVSHHLFPMNALRSGKPLWFRRGSSLAALADSFFVSIAESAGETCDVGLD